MEVVDTIGNETVMQQAVIRTNEDENAVAKALREWTTKV